MNHLNIKANGAIPEVTIDGVNIANHASGLILTLEAGDVPKVDLTLPILTKVDADVDAIVRIVNQWIPCSERLPGPYEVVLVSIEWEGKDYEPYVSLGSWEHEQWSCLVSESRKFQPAEKIVAWQPLPDPYKEAE